MFIVCGASAAAAGWVPEHEQKQHSSVINNIKYNNIIVYLENTC